FFFFKVLSGEHHFHIWPQKYNFATELSCSPGAPRPMKIEFTRQPRGAHVRYTGGGDSHRASEARNRPTRGRHQDVRDRVQYAPGAKRERHEKTKKRSKGLDNCGHIEGLNVKSIGGTDMALCPYAWWKPISHGFNRGLMMKPIQG